MFEIKQVIAAVRMSIVLAVFLWWAAPQARAQAVDSETCLECHDDMAATLRHTAHRLSLEIRKPSTAMECASCHTDAATHVEDPTADNIGNPASQSAERTLAVCGACHQPHAQAGRVGLDPHAGLDLSCTSCHNIHGLDTPSPAAGAAGACGGCHVAVVNQFRLRSNHPLTSGNVACTSCHDFTGKAEPQFGHGGSANCWSCHPEQSSPVLFEHEAGSSFTTEGDGCLACHRPHGSPNDRLLNQPDERLCRQCHGVPPLHRTQHNGIGMATACIECHSAVHGSNDNEAFLDPQLGSKIGGEPASCFCHGTRE